MSYNDRSWILRRTVPGFMGITDDFQNGVKEFLLFAMKNCSEPNRMIRCPCSRCRNTQFKIVDDVELDLYMHGFCESYTVWTFHGETVEHVSRAPVIDGDLFDTFEMLRDAGGPNYWRNTEAGSSGGGWNNEEPNEETSNFYKLVNDAGVPIYPGNTKFTKLSFLTKLLHFKNSHGCSDKGFDELITLLRDVLPVGHTLPEKYYDIKKMFKGLTMGYEKIDACMNDCMLYYGDEIDKTQCNYCGLSRYKDVAEGGSTTIPRKIMRYFPLTPRLQRLYMSSHTAEKMKWWKNRVVTEGVLTHPADGDEWKEFDKNFPSFSREVRNVRVGLATDGFSPYSNAFSIQYSMWPVIMVIYNLPPYMCMKDAYMFMTLLIPGEKSPTRDINVYLRPLIDELKKLWQFGADTYDASSKTNFTLKAALLWTISDFPALGMISGWSTHGKLSCHVCTGEVKGFQLPYSKKCTFWGTAKDFVRRGNRPRRRTWREVRSQCLSLLFPPPEKVDIRLRAEGFGSSHNWTHLTLFYELPYWYSLRLRHCIDVMHTEKNVFDNVFHSLIGTTGKTKDNINARNDLKALDLREELWVPHGSKRLPPAPYTLTRVHLELLCDWVKALKMPDGYASNIARCSKVEQLKFQGMKSHDCHVFLHKLMPSAFRELLPPEVNNVITDLSNFFRGLCSTTLHYINLKKMEANIVSILCELETIFPPSFFDSMEHLPVHLPEECILGGPVQFLPAIP